MAVLADIGVPALRQLLDKAGRLGDLGRRYYLGLAGLGPAVEHVVAHRAREQGGGLADQGYRAAQRLQSALAHVVAVEPGRPAQRVVEAQQHAHRSGLARARGPHQADCLARGHIEVDAPQDILASGVGELDVLEADVARDTL